MEGHDHNIYCNVNSFLTTNSATSNVSNRYLGHLPICSSKAVAVKCGWQQEFLTMYSFQSVYIHSNILLSTALVRKHLDRYSCSQSQPIANDGFTAVYVNPALSADYFKSEYKSYSTKKSSMVKAWLWKV